MKTKKPSEWVRVIKGMCDDYAVGGSGQPVYASLRTGNTVRVISARTREGKLEIQAIYGDWLTPDDWDTLRCGSQVLFISLP